MDGILVPTIHSLLGWFNVRDYSAKGDGSTDDTTAVQNAVNACWTAGGGTVTEAECAELRVMGAKP